MASTRVKGHETITKKSDNYIISRVILKQNQLSTCYWCSIINPDYNGTLKISNIIHIQYDTTATTACDNASVLVAQINNTCAVVNKSHDSSDNVNGVTVIFISCMCTIISVLLFLFLGTVYWRLHNHKGLLMLLMQTNMSWYFLIVCRCSFAQSQNSEVIIIINSNDLTYAAGCYIIVNSYDIYREPTEIDLQELAVSFS